MILLVLLLLNVLYFVFTMYFRVFFKCICMFVLLFGTSVSLAVLRECVINKMYLLTMNIALIKKHTK